MSQKTKPIFSKNAINKAGEAIRKHENYVRIDSELYFTATIVENHRAAHAYVLNKFQANLRNRSKGKNITFAQRLKRRPTIHNKLRREEKMNLARMHDIAGCRLIFPSLDELDQFQREFRNARFRHIRRHKESEIDPYDYIAKPKKTGYRGRHDVFEYRAYAKAGAMGRPVYRSTVPHTSPTCLGNRS